LGLLKSIQHRSEILQQRSCNRIRWSFFGMTIFPL